jgi:hypothetical protein
MFLKKNIHLYANVLNKKKINYSIHNINFFKKRYKFIKFNKFNFLLNYRYNLIFKKKKLKKELFIFFFNFFFKINFKIFNIKLILNLNITLKKLQLIKDNYRVVLKNSKFKK